MSVIPVGDVDPSIVFPEHVGPENGGRSSVFRRVGVCHTSLVHLLFLFRGDWEGRSFQGNSVPPLGLAGGGGSSFLLCDGIQLSTVHPLDLKT